MAAALPALKSTAYTVGLITVLPCEFAAAIAILDTRHQQQDIPYDDTIYAAGSVSGHNVIIACSGEAGIGRASACATHMLRSFPAIRVGLLVGIAGGVPTAKTDIRLGDVVVSQPGNGHGGVAFYDPGKLTACGFISTGHLNRPPPKLCQAITWLQTQRIAGDTTFESLLADIGSNPRHSLPADCPDVLHDASDTSEIVHRPARDNCTPWIHYGLIASGSWVIKESGSKRANLIRQVNGEVLAFEMEAAGLMNSFPCLVIRGISDYCDSYKNDGWHDYASATAACYAKWLLGVLSRDDMSVTDLALRATEKPRHSEFDGFDQRELWSLVRSSATPWTSIVDRVSDYGFERVQRRISRQRCPNTCQWFVEDAVYQSWNRAGDRTGQCLWLSGGVGSGKTVICSLVVDHQRHASLRQRTAVAFLYCDPSEPKTLDPSYILASLTKQILHHCEEQNHVIPSNQEKLLRSFFESNSKVPDTEDHEDIFDSICEISPDAMFVVDGLHELEPMQLRKIAGIFRKTAKRHAYVRFFLTSRDGYHSIGTEYKLIARLTKQDIISFIDMELDPTITDNQTLVQDLKTALSEKSRGMFLWVRLQIITLSLECKTDGDIRAALDKLPRDLPETYMRCLEKAAQKDFVLARDLFTWVTLALRPLSVSELQEALSVSLEDTRLNAEKFPPKSRLLQAGAHLIVEDELENTVQFIHPSVRAFLRDVDICPGRFLVTDDDNTLLRDLCIQYLSLDDFSQGLQKTSNTRHNVYLPSPMTSLATTVSGTGGLVSRLFPRSTAVKPSYVSASFKKHIIDPVKSPATKFTLLDYVRKYWPEHTRTSFYGSHVWDKFRTLVLEQNTVWQFQPWAKDRLSDNAYLHALLSWATRNDHGVILSIVFHQVRTHPRAREIHRLCDLPYAHDGMPALHIAARLGLSVVVEDLLDFCNINIPGPDDMTALHFASEKNQQKVVMALLASKKVKVNQLSWFGESPLGTSVRHDAFEVFRLLLERRDIDPNSCAPSTFTPICMAIHKGHLRMVQLLIAQDGLEINARQRWQPTKSELSSGRGFQVTGRFEVRNAHGRTPLSIAVQEKQLSLLRLFVLDHRVNIDSQDDDGNTPLHLAMAHGSTEMSIILLDVEEKNIVVTQASAVLLGTRDKSILQIFNDEHLTPLALGVRCGHLGILEKMHNFGRPDNSRDLQGKTSLFWAAERGQLDMVESLVREGYDPNVKDNEGSSALLVATQQGHFDLIRLLCESRSCDLNICDAHGDTALIVAMRTGQYRIASELIKQERCDLIGKKKHNKPTLGQVIAFGGEEVTRALLQRTDLTFDLSVYPTRQFFISIFTGQDSVLIALLVANKFLSLESLVHDLRALLFAAAKRDPSLGLTFLLNCAKTNSSFNDEMNLFLNAEDESRMTPLLHAAESGPPSSVLCLLEHEPLLVNRKDLFGQSALHLAALRPAFAMEIVEMLLKAPYVVAHCKNDQGQTPLMCAVEAQQFDVARLFMRFRSSGFAPVDDAKFRPWLYSHVRYLALPVDATFAEHLSLQAKADPGGVFLSMIMFWAAFFGNITLVKTLLDMGVDVNVQNEKGESPLLWAVECRHVAMIELLMGKGCRLDHKNEAVLRILGRTGANSQEDERPLLTKLGIFWF